MRNRVYVHAVLIALIGAVTAPATGTPTNMQCNYPATKMITDRLIPGVGLFEVIRYLRKSDISFMVFSEDEQKVDISNLNEQQIEILGNLTIGVLSESAKKGRLITENEILTIRFDDNQRLINYSCKKHYTGP